MKTLKTIAIGIMMLLVSNSITAQVSVNVNLGSPPSWGPSGYDNVDYYYLPDIEAYYDIRSTQFIYFNSGNWVRSRHLPRQYRNYNLNNGYVVVLNDYHGSRPYASFKNHKVKYYKGYKGASYKSIGYKKSNFKEHKNYDNNDNKGNNGKGNKGNGKNKH